MEIYIRDKTSLSPFEFITQSLFPLVQEKKCVTGPKSACVLKRLVSCLLGLCKDYKTLFTIVVVSALPHIAHSSFLVGVIVELFVL